MFSCKDSCVHTGIHTERERGETKDFLPKIFTKLKIDSTKHEF